MSTLERKFHVSYVITNLSSMSTGDRRFGPLEEHFNVPWSLMCSRNEEDLAVHLHCEKFREANKSWSVRARYNFKLLSPNGQSVLRSCAYTFSNSSEFNSYGSVLYVGWNRLIEEFASKDSIIVEAHVVIEEMSGIEGPQKMRSFNETNIGLSDVVLKVADEKFFVSKLTLASQSPVFQTLFFGQFREAHQSEITLNDVEPEVFQCFLELLYHEPSLTYSNIESVLHLTDMYDTKHLTRLCEDYLINESKHSLRNKIRFGARFKLGKLIKHCIASMKSSADVCSVMGPDLNQLDHTITEKLLEKALLL